VGLGVGRKQEGRPMVWETREVCGEMNHSRFASFHLLMSKMCQDIHCPLMRPTKHTAPYDADADPNLDTCTGTCHPIDPSHLFVCMPAQTLATTGVRLTCST